MQFTRSNALIDHAFGNRRPQAGETWRTRKGNREVRVDLVEHDVVSVTGLASGRRSNIRIDIFISQYVPKGGSMITLQPSADPNSLVVVREGKIVGHLLWHKERSPRFVTIGDWNCGYLTLDEMKEMTRALDEAIAKEKR